MKLRPVTKLNKGNKTTSKRVEIDVTPAKSDVIVFLKIYGQFVATQNLDSGCMVYKVYILIIVIFYLTEPENRTKEHSYYTIALTKGTIFVKNADFCKKCYIAQYLLYSFKKLRD